MDERSAVGKLIRHGRRRQIRNLLVHEASFAAVLALGGFLLLLLLGTQVLNWYWPVILFVGSLGIGAYRARNKFLSSYEVAQSLDARLNFSDALSTAYFFDQHTDPAVASPEVVEYQGRIAEDLARTADVRRGIPFIAPRTLYINAALAVAVLGMFGLRYGINHSLELRSSLVHMSFDGFLGSGRDMAAAKRIRGERPFEEETRRDAGATPDPGETKPADMEQQPDSTIDTLDQNEASNPEAGADPAGKQSKAAGKDNPPPGKDQLDQSDKGQPSQSDKESADGGKASPEDKPESGNQSDNAKNSNPQGNSNENPSLTDKMKDALANLLAKLKVQPKNEGKQGGSQAQNNSQSQQQKSQNKDSNSKGSQGEQQSQQNANSQSQSEQQSQNGSQQAADGKSEAKNSDRSTENGKSGVGKQDGDKSAREAEQLAAMGKISEIIGKRAEHVTGEVMVEVASGKQQLRTQYSQRNAEHVEAGGEINRDEVPLAYQQYVQHYFEAIRKAPPAAKATSDGKAKSSGN
jgi:hypothetical protein